MTATAADPRRAMLARVHIAKKEMGLPDEAYRDVLVRITTKASAGDCSAAQLGLVLEEFRRLGWKPKQGRPLSANMQVRIIYAIWGDVKKLLDGETGDAELRAFVRRQTGRDAPEFCNHEQCVAVIEGLKGWRTRLRNKEAA